MLLPASGRPWKSWAFLGLPASLRSRGVFCLCLHYDSSACVQIPPFPKDTGHSGLGPTNDLALLWLPLARRSHSEVLGLPLGGTPSAGGLTSPAAWNFTSPVCSPTEPGGRAAQGEAGPGLRGEVGRQPDHGGSSPAPDAMPQVRGLPADRVRRVPLLQGHEEVRRPRADEAELYHAAVHRGEWAEGAPRPFSPRPLAPLCSLVSPVPLLKERVSPAETPERCSLGKRSAVFRFHMDSGWACHVLGLRFLHRLMILHLLPSLDDWGL